MTCSSTEGQGQGEGGPHMEANLFVSFTRAYLDPTSPPSHRRNCKRKFAESQTHPASTSLLNESGERPHKKATTVVSPSETQVEPMSIDSMGRPQKTATKVMSVSESFCSTQVVEPMSIDGVRRPQETATKVTSVSENFCATQAEPMECDEWKSSLVPMEVDDQANGETSIPDMDSGDLADPLAEVQYFKEIHEFYWSDESLSCVNPRYMSDQPDINEKMRAVLIDWIFEVHDKLELLQETLFLTVNLVDRFLAIQNISSTKLQLVGVTALLLACKYEEATAPPIEDLIAICVCSYTRAELLEMERLMLNTLQFNMWVPTPYVFLKRFLKAAKSDKKMELLSFFIAKLCLVDFRMLQFKPSILAAAAVFTAQCTLIGCPIWSKCSEVHSRYRQDQLIECSIMMVELQQRSGQGKLTGVYRKFCTAGFGSAAKSVPALFLAGTKTESSSLEYTELLGGNNNEERTPNLNSAVVQSLESSKLDVDDTEMEEMIEDQVEDEGIILDMNTPLAPVEPQEFSEMKEIEAEMKDIYEDQVEDDNGDEVDDGEEGEEMIIAEIQ